MKARVCRTVLAILLVAQAFATEFFVATNGTPTGDGTRLRPWDLATALGDNTKTSNANNVVKPGDTIWLLGGTYYCHSTNWPFGIPYRLAGSSNGPVIVRGLPGQRAIIDGYIYQASPADWVWFWGFEITCSSPRTNTYTFRPGGLNMTTTGCKAINLVCHNTGHSAIGGQASEIYGCIIWGAGIYEVSDPLYPTNAWARGSGLYLQGDGRQKYIVADNISSRNLTSGMKAYAERGRADGFIFDGNVVFENGGAGIEIDCLYNSITNAVVINNVTYNCLKTPMGYFSSDSLAQHQSLTYSNNYEIGKPGSGAATLWLKRWRNLQVVNNTIITLCSTNDWSAGSGVGALGSGGKFIELYPPTNAVLSYVINSNAYFGGVEQSADWYSWSVINGTNWYGPFYRTYQPFRYKYSQVSPPDCTNGLLSFAAWTNAHGFDLNSTYTTNVPLSNKVFLRPNKYEKGRANLVVINWESNATVNVDFSALGLTNGQSFEVRDVQNYFGNPVVRANYTTLRPTVIIPLTMTNVTAVKVEGDHQYSHTSSLFNVFVVVPVEHTVSLSPASSLTIDSK